MPTDKIRKYILPNIPYLLIGWACLKLGTAYRMAAGAGFGEKLLGLGRSIGPAFADFAPGLDPFDWLVGLVGAVAFRLLIYLMSTEQTPVFFAAPKYPAMLSKLAKGRTESYGDSARGPTWQSHEQRFPAALQ